MNSHPSKRRIKEVEIIEQPTYKNGTVKYVELGIIYSNGRTISVKTTRIYATGVSVLAMLHCDRTAYMVLVEQFLPTVGAMSTSIPNSRVRWHGTVRDTAFSELDEALGLTQLAWSEPTNLTERLLDKPAQGLTGATWENIQVVHTSATITPAHFQRLQERTVSEDEPKVVLVPVSELYAYLREFSGEVSIKLLAARDLYYEAKRQDILS